MKWTRLAANAFAQRLLRQSRQAAITVILAGLLPAVISAGSPQVAALRFSVPFVENDYSRALADARKRNVPLFIDEWAPW